MINFLLNHTPLFYWTQSLWRDEAFSVWIAQDSVSEVIRRTSGDFNPPLYYLLLHFWMRLFGRSEVAMRSLSLVAFLLFLIVVYLFAKKMFRSTTVAQLTTFLMAGNPMLLYFAFELRMYSFLILFTMLSMYFFYTKRWVWYILTSALGMYTQPFMAFVILTQMGYLLVTKQLGRIAKNALGIGLLFAPWILILLTQFRSSGPMWMYPVDLNLVTTVLGNLYFGYEGTPGGLWLYMQLTSLLLIIMTLWLWRHKRKQKELRLLLCWIGIPLLLVLGISLVKPIYVHRYLIYVTVGEVLLVSYFIFSIKKRSLQKFIAFGLVSITILVNLFVVNFHRKVNLRQTFATIRSQLRESDMIYAQTPLVYYESLYYAPDPTRVYLYNPYQITPPRYVGSVGMPPSVWKNTYPTLPSRAFIIGENGQYHVQSENK